MRARGACSAVRMKTSMMMTMSCSDGVNEMRDTESSASDRAASGSDPVLTGLPPVGGRAKCDTWATSFSASSSRSNAPHEAPLTSETGLEKPQTCRPILNLKPLMRGSTGEVPEGFLSRKECIEFLLRQAIHHFLEVFLEIGLPLFCRLTQASHFVEGTRRAR